MLCCARPLRRLGTVFARTSSANTERALSCPYFFDGINLELVTEAAEQKILGGSNRGRPDGQQLARPCVCLSAAAAAAARREEAPLLLASFVCAAAAADTHE